MVLRQLEDGMFYLFLSHQQVFGQDQVEAMKYKVEGLLPGVEIFIDTDAGTSQARAFRMSMTWMT